MFPIGNYYGIQNEKTAIVPDRELCRHQWARVRGQARKKESRLTIGPMGEWLAGDEDRRMWLETVGEAWDKTEW